MLKGKTLYFLISLLWLSNSIWAQNSIAVTNIQSPQANYNYNSNETVDIRVFVKNNGPYDLRPTDSLLFQYNISSADTVIELQKVIEVGVFLDSSAGTDYTLYTDFAFPLDGFYSVCAEVIGSQTFPNNLEKRPSACSYFPVGIEKNKLQLEHLYYSNGSIQYEVSSNYKVTLNLYDISGKLLIEEKLTNRKGEVNCSKLSPAIYFIVLTDEKGNNYSSKLLIQ